MSSVKEKRCPACMRDPYPRGPLACASCREFNRQVSLFPDHVAGLARAIDDYVVDVRLGRSPDLTGMALHGAVAAYYRAERLGPVPDLSDAHVDRVERHLFRTFDDVNIGREPLHDFDVVDECERGDHWRALAREAIRLGTVLAAEEDR